MLKLLGVLLTVTVIVMGTQEGLCLIECVLVLLSKLLAEED